MDTNSPIEQQKPKINLDDTKEYVCTCGSTLFTQAFNIREVSPLLTGTGNTEYIPVTVLVCERCKKSFERPKIVS
jgi:hypothetical protein